MPLTESERHRRPEIDALPVGTLLYGPKTYEHLLVTGNNAKEISFLQLGSARTYLPHSWRPRTLEFSTAKAVAGANWALTRIAYAKKASAFIIRSKDTMLSSIKRRNRMLFRG